MGILTLLEENLNEAQSTYRPLTFTDQTPLSIMILNTFYIKLLVEVPHGLSPHVLISGVRHF
jgi:hypothetical protein